MSKNRKHIHYNCIEDLEPLIRDYVETVSGEKIEKVGIDTVNDFLNDQIDLELGQIEKVNLN